MVGQLKRKCSKYPSHGWPTEKKGAPNTPVIVDQLQKENATNTLAMIGPQKIKCSNYTNHDRPGEKKYDPNTLIMVGRDLTL